MNKVVYNNVVYEIINDCGNSYEVKRAGSNEIIAIPKDQSSKIFEEGKPTFNVHKKLNG